MAYEHIQTSLDASVLTLTLHRPDALNAITPRMLTELRDALEASRSNDTVKVVVLTGSGRAFSAGVDLKALGEVTLTGGSVGDILDKPARAAIDSIRTVPQPVIARVNGFCFTPAKKPQRLASRTVRYRSKSSTTPSRSWSLSCSRTVRNPWQPTRSCTTRARSIHRRTPKRPAPS